MKIENKHTPALRAYLDKLELNTPDLAISLLEEPSIKDKESIRQFYREFTTNSSKTITLPKPLQQLLLTQTKKRVISIIRQGDTNAVIQLLQEGSFLFPYKNQLLITLLNWQYKRLQRDQSKGTFSEPQLEIRRNRIVNDCIKLVSDKPQNDLLILFQSILTVTQSFLFRYKYYLLIGGLLIGGVYYGLFNYYHQEIDIIKRKIVIKCDTPIPISTTIDGFTYKSTLQKDSTFQIKIPRYKLRELPESIRIHYGFRKNCCFILFNFTETKREITKDENDPCW